jgi:hypothetical protein
MEIQLQQFSITVKGNQHNPTIINPDFLRIRKIVPAEWNWEVDDKKIFISPSRARVAYKTGVVILVEPSNAQFIDLTKVPPIESKIKDIAVEFVSTLKHVRYEAVGTNFYGIIEMPEPDNYLKTRFLKQGRWDIPEHPVTSVGLKLSYPAVDGTLYIVLDSGSITQKNSPEGLEKKVLLISANFHRECKGIYPSDSLITSFVQNIPGDWSQFHTVFNDIIEQ